MKEPGDDFDQFRRSILDELNSIMEETHHDEDTLKSFKGKYDGKYLTFRDKGFTPARVTIDFQSPTVVAIIEKFTKPIPIGKFTQMLTNGSVKLQDEE